MFSKIIRFLSLLIFFVAVSCKKKETPAPPVTPEPSEPSQFEIPFAEVPLPSDMVLYEINPRAFSTSVSLNNSLILNAFEYRIFKK